MRIDLNWLQKMARLAFWASCFVLIALSLAPQQALPKVSLWDKALHAGAYAFLATLGGIALRDRWKAVGISLMALGASIELAQSWVPGRAASFGDVLANAVGVVMGLALAGLAGWAVRRRFRRLGWATGGR